LHLTPRTEPGDLDPARERRPDIQIDLPEVTLLADVTVSHPNAKKWRRMAAMRGVESVGDSRQAEKDDLYTPMTEALDMEFSPFVLYTYGGFHKSALSFIRRLGSALDPATSLISHTKWKKDLMEHIAVAVQRGNAEVMMNQSTRLRGMSWPAGRSSRSFRGRPPVMRGRTDHSGRGAAKTGEGGEAIGDRAAQLAAQLIPPPLSLREGDAMPSSDAESDDAATAVRRAGSHLHPMQIDTDVEESSPSCPEQFVPESPLSAPCAAVDEVKAEAGSGSPSPSCFVPGTPPGQCERGTKQQMEGAVSTLQRPERKQGGADERVDAVRTHRDDARRNGATSAVVATAAVVIDGDGMEVEAGGAVLWRAVEGAGVVVSGAGVMVEGAV
jgi:hypothetical protein